MSGVKAAMTRVQCGGRWENGPKDHLLMPPHKARALLRLKEEPMEEVFGEPHPEAHVAEGSAEASALTL
eukprot:5517817-Pyramimonas_sp.AAC.1